MGDKLKYTELNYNNKFVCTYRSFNEESDCLLCYQIQLLQAFNMIEYNDFILQNNIRKIYDFLRDKEEIIHILDILSKKNVELEIFKHLTKDLETIFAFQLLFSYDYFDIFHKCFSKYYDALKENRENTEKFFLELEAFILKH